jgi:glycosyltransferase involved in cell wall biosynthesis
MAEHIAMMAPESLKASVKPAHGPIFIIVPAYNESPVIQDTLMPLLSLGYSIVVVDDGSSDDTYEKICQLPVHVLRHPINLGQGAALQTGMTYALSQGASAIVHFDADGQHPPDRIRALLAPILSQNADIVLGSRFLEKRTSQAVPLHKRWVLKLGTLFTGLITNVWLSDTHNGLRALSRTAAQKLSISEPRMAHASEIIGLIGKHQLRYDEIPVQIHYTEYARRKGQPIWNALNIVIDIFLGRIFP